MLLNLSEPAKGAIAQGSHAPTTTTTENPTLNSQFMKALDEIWPQAKSLSVENSFLIGPFENTDYIGWATAYPPELDPGAATDTGKTYPGKNGNVRWRRQTNLDGLFAEPGKFTDAADAGGSTVTYYSTEVRATAPTAALFSVQCSGLVKVWINGALVNCAAVFEQANADGATGWIALKPGANRILVKMAFDRSPNHTLAAR